ncbi:hypothetical protein DL770_001095 [Monosporascus sp. CRB-9-2]|nr:hypothetical protein DL770_001095 [Monosporascus sp. CRB-9-2]
MEDIFLPYEGSLTPPRLKQEVICHLFEDGEHTKTTHKDWEGLPSLNSPGKNALIRMVETWRVPHYLNAFDLRESLDTALYEDSIFDCGPKIFHDHVRLYTSAHALASKGYIFLDPEPVCVQENRSHLRRRLRRTSQKGNTTETACTVRGAQWVSSAIEKLSYDGDVVKFANSIKLLIFEYVVDETLLVLSPLFRALSDVQSHLSDDERVQRHLHSFQKFLNEWTQQCFEISASLSYMRDKVDLSKAPDALLTKDRHLQSLIKSAIPRIEGLHQALMSSMSIIDSKEAIREAKAVGKLTQLAFFFIPLTLIAGIFGMNVVKVLDQDMLCFAGG